MILGGNFLYLADIVESARTVACWFAERREHRHEDEVLQNAALRQLSVVGEAASCLALRAMGGTIRTDSWSLTHYPDLRDPTPDLVTPGSRR